MPRAAPIPRPVLAGLALAVALDTVIQIAWKLGVAGVDPGSGAAAILRGALASPWFYGAMLAFAAQLANWVKVLSRADLSFAQPFTALSYVTVLGISSLALHESISPARVAGVALIFLGVFFISRTPSATSPS